MKNITLVLLMGIMVIQLAYAGGESELGQRSSSVADLIKKHEQMQRQNSQQFSGKSVRMVRPIKSKSIQTATLRLKRQGLPEKLKKEYLRKYQSEPTMANPKIVAIDEAIPAVLIEQASVPNKEKIKPVVKQKENWFNTFGNLRAERQYLIRSLFKMCQSEEISADQQEKFEMMRRNYFANNEIVETDQDQFLKEEKTLQERCQFFPNASAIREKKKPKRESSLTRLFSKFNKKVREIARKRKSCSVEN